MKTHLGFNLLLICLIGFSSIFTFGVVSQTNPADAEAMLSLKNSLNPPDTLGWSDPDPCKWSHVDCSNDNRVTRIQIGRQNLQGNLPPTLSNLTELQRDFFMGLSALQSVDIGNNPFSAWEIPRSILNASSLQNFSANSANITGEIPAFLGPDGFPSLVNLHLAFNGLEGGLPAAFSGSQIESLWVNGQGLSGGIEVIGNMTLLKEVWLHSNSFSGPLPDFSGLKGLEVLSLRDNSFTGPVPVSLVNLGSLQVVNLTNNLLQGPMPKFNDSVAVDMREDSNSFCLPQPGDCDLRVNTLISIVKSVDYPVKFAESWKGNDPCADWFGITCNGGNVTIVNFQNMGLNGTISPEFVSIKSLQRLILADNNLTGTIPEELTTLPALSEIDLENNNLYGKVPAFKSNVIMNTHGNPDIGKEKSNSSSSGASPNGGNNGSSKSGQKSRHWIGILVFSLIVGLIVIFLIGLAAFCWYNKKQKRFTRVQSPNAMVVHPQSFSDNEGVKITVAGSSVSVGAVSETHTVPSGETSDIQMVEAGNMVISIQVLRNVTNNFSQDNILGQGGFGTVYKGELHDGTKIAVKRMESGVIAGKGLTLALDVARGVEYLHSLAHQSFIHRDLKPSNILLGDDMRAKVADFGLVRLAPEGKGSIETRIAGTFGYLAPEYAGPFRKAIDPSIDLTEETLASISTVAELAGHCCAREPYQRPDMGHAVNVLSSLVELWKPSDQSSEDVYGIDFEMSLPQALKKWQDFEGRSHLDSSSSSFPPSLDNTQTVSRLGLLDSRNRLPLPMVGDEKFGYSFWW
ncbi:hypothetical protein C3L33_18334, partial [Rhododendron williamsianum]